jgi:hypothetical protein
MCVLQHLDNPDVGEKLWFENDGKVTLNIREIRKRLNTIEWSRKYFPCLNRSISLNGFFELIDSKLKENKMILSVEEGEEVNQCDYRALELK